MLKCGYKLIICVVLISALFIGFGSCFASAATPVWLLRAKAGVAAALLAMNLVTTPVNVVLDSPFLEAVDPEGKLEWVETLPEYLDRSTIKVVENTAIIDGVEYSDVWLGPDAANTLRLQGLDFATAYNIANNQSEPISYAEGVGYIEELPVYSVPDGTSTPYRTQGFRVSDPGSYSLGTSSLVVSQNSARYPWTLTSSLSTTTSGNPTSSSYPRIFYFKANSSMLDSGIVQFGSESNAGVQSFKNIECSTDTSSFSFDYVSGVIDAPLDPEDGLLVRVPTLYTDPQSGSVIYDIHDFTVNYPDISQPGGHEIELDPSLNPDFETDIYLGNGIGDLLVTIFGLDLLRRFIDFAPEPTTPEPGPQPGVIDPLPDPDPAPDEPIAGTTIGDTDWVVLDEILRWIQSTIDSIRHITESLQTMLDSLFDQIQTLIQTLQELPQQILEDIETGPSKVFRKALDILKSIFLPLLLPIRAMMNLWHYVVEWIGSVASPFTWIFGVMSNTSYNLVLPIYASLAGAICIAIYKALGR